MRHLFSSSLQISQLGFRPIASRRQPRHRWLRATLALVVLGTSLLPLRLVRAESAATAPSQVKQTLAQIDAAANQRNLQAVLQFYTPNFANSDGLNRQSFGQALTEFWNRYPKVTYRTEIRSWQAEGKGYSVETVTSITGTQKVGGRALKLEATVRSKQYWEGQKIVRQEILAERSQLTSGAKPPAVEVNLPEQVAPGESYSFDVIVKEPVGNSILMGAAIEEVVKSGGYFNQPAVRLESLQAGGIFKVGKAPNSPENRWLSAVLVREDGMVLITRRLRVVAR